VSISFEVRVHDGYVVLECTGTYTLESTLQMYEQAFEIARREGRGAALVDAREVTGVPPTFGERYDQGVHVAKLQSTQAQRIRLAVLGHEPMVHPEKIGEIVAVSRGAVARVFTDPDEALAWISG
jgi:hypothetical protein